MSSDVGRTTKSVVECLPESEPPRPPHSALPLACVEHPAGPRPCGSHAAMIRLARPSKQGKGKPADTSAQHFTRRHRPTDRPQTEGSHTQQRPTVSVCLVSSLHFDPPADSSPVEGKDLRPSPRPIEHRLRRPNDGNSAVDNDLNGTRCSEVRRHRKRSVPLAISATTLIRWLTCRDLV